MATPLLSIKDPPLYRYSTSPAGTILEQNPPQDTQLTGPVEVSVVVSRGPENDRVTVPSIIGLSITDTLITMGRAQVIFDFTSRIPEGKENAGTVVSQMPAENSLAESSDGKVYGIFTETLPTYPYPFQIKLEAVTPKGERYELVSMKHPGGSFSVPYAVQDGTVLVLTILNKEVESVEIHADQNVKIVAPK